MTNRPYDGVALTHTYLNLASRNRIADFPPKPCSNSYRPMPAPYSRKGLGSNALAVICVAQERTCIKLFKTRCCER